MNTRRTILLAATALIAFAAQPARAADSDWPQKVAKLIGDGYSYPRSAQLRGDQGTAKVKITISGAGKVVSVDLVQATGSAILDREAVRIPTKVGNFPAPPNGANKTIIVPITWRMS